MDINEHKTPVTRTGVYYTAGDRAQSIRQWLCCHGYGQRADFMIRKFNKRVKHQEYALAVEGPNRFYWEGVTGEIVATWMTSRFRLDEIRDNNAFLSRVYDTEIDKSKQRILFGFSQGGTTLWRWIHDKKPDFDVFINYAGWIPEDIDLSTLQDHMQGKKLIYAFGDQDQYLTDDRLKKAKAIIADSKLDINIHPFQGEHKIYRKVVDDIIANLD